VVWIWGENKQGELGLGDSAPRQVPDPSNYFQTKKISKVIAADGYSIALVKKIIQST
jgi:alpha-tubulin suppressor-like RCC1 family protein